MRPCIIGLGSNEGDSLAIFRAAATKLAAVRGVSIRTASSLYASAPAGGPKGQREFLNAALWVDAEIESIDLLDTLQEIESQLGRERTVRWGPRTLDLDLLLDGQTICFTDRLILPHPRFALRRFAVVPAAEVAPQLIHPQLGWTLPRLRDHLYSSAKRVVLIASDKDFLADWQNEVEASTGWQIDATLSPATREFLDRGGLPRFIASPVDSLYEDELLAGSTIGIHIYVESQRSGPAAAEVVAHCLASDTILEVRAGPDWCSI